MINSHVSADFRGQSGSGMNCIPTGRADRTAEIKARLTISQIGERLFPAWSSGKSCRSPFRDDKNPSFSVFADGAAWKDHATGEAGDIFTFYQKATGLPFKDAVEKLEVLAGIHEEKQRPQKKSHMHLPVDLHEGGVAELAIVAKLRGINSEACQLAAGRGLLKFGAVAGFPCWLLLDQTRKKCHFSHLSKVDQICSLLFTLRTPKAMPTCWAWSRCSAHQIPFQRMLYHISKTSASEFFRMMMQRD